MKRLDRVLMLAAVPITAVNVYLVAMLVFAWLGKRSRAPAPATALHRRFAVLVPAHDEESGLARTLRSILAVDAAPGRLEVVVIADNCSDRTADVARGFEAVTVLERHDPDRRGKGHALRWALDELLPRAAPRIDAFVVIDADCAPSHNLLRVIDIEMDRGASAVQVDYVVGNADASWASALRFAAFTGWNTVRPMGKSRLRLSAGLLGTGMAFSRDLLERHPWDAFSIVEDAEYHARLVLHGEIVAFAPEAEVRSDMPTSLRGGEEQQMRWEGGRSVMIRAWTPRLVAAGLRRRDPVRTHAGLEPLVPAQSLMGTAEIAFVVAALVLRAPRTLALAAANVAAHIVFVLGSLWLVRAPLAVYRALAFAPVLVLQKLAVYARVAAGRSPQTFVRTTRG